MSDSVKLHPKVIRFSQSSISKRFSGALNGQHIGNILDKVYEGDLELLKEKILKNIKVGRWNQPGFENLWFTVNNRSLWVLKELEVLGKMDGSLEIPIDPNGIHKTQFTTENKGVCVAVRGGEVGGVHKVDAPFWKYKQQVIYSGRFEGYQSADYDEKQFTTGDEACCKVFRGGEVGGVLKEDTPIWKYKQQVKDYAGFAVWESAEDEDDEYDSDEYYS